MAFHRLFNKELLFYGNDILVVAQHFSADKCVITFTSRMDEADIPPAPFASDLLTKECCSHICFIALSNHWWQTPEFELSILHVLDHIRSKAYRKIISYGGSMGGVGVIHSSELLKPDEAIVFGAQFDISPITVPWDGRWHSDGARLAQPLKSKSDKANKATEYIFVYDQNTLDTKHFEYFKGFLSIRGLRLPFSGHETFSTLKQIGLAGQVARCLLLSEKSLDERSKEVRALYRANRRGAISYWRYLAQKLVKHKRAGLAKQALLQALKLNPSDSSTLLSIGWHCLVHSKKPVEAETYFNACVTRNPKHPAAWRGKSKCRTAVGDHLAALEFSIAALARNPGNHDLSRVFLEASSRANNSFFGEISSKRYLKLNSAAINDDFFKRFAKPEYLKPDVDDEKRLGSFEKILDMIGNRNPQRYTQLLHFLVTNQPRSIAEVGVFNGENALQMLQAAGVAILDARKIKYFGFDLFEQMTDDKFKSEFSKIPLKQADIQPKISSVTDDGCLIIGDTVLTLPEFAKNAQRENVSLDFVFLDGGHSESTIESDWSNICKIISEKSVVYFDDYYVDKSPALEGKGCNCLIDRLSIDPAYCIEILPIVDQFDKDFGLLKVAMVKVSKASSG